MSDELKPIYVERLKEFAREILMCCWDDRCSIDESDILDIALKHKIIRKEFAPKEWSEENGCDHWHTFQKWLKKEIK